MPVLQLLIIFNIVYWEKRSCMNLQTWVQFKNQRFKKPSFRVVFHKKIVSGRLSSWWGQGGSDFNWKNRRRPCYACFFKFRQNSKSIIFFWENSKYNWYNTIFGINCFWDKSNCWRPARIVIQIPADKPDPKSCGNCLEKPAMPEAWQEEVQKILFCI